MKPPEVLFDLHSRTKSESNPHILKDRVPTCQGNLVFLQGQGKVREICKMVREIKKSSKVREF